MYQIVFTHTYKKQSKYYLRDSKIQKKFLDIVEYLVAWETLPASYKDHTLKWQLSQYRELHINPDILLVYKKNDGKKIITLAYMWTHSDLFG
jgi:mRNA interferase YafQ